ncbi:fatty acid desaturase [Kordia sp.]|uniref:fatty acid desaturase family protein n=1 Tax=Kordia sp. TaxID=1965332 RepID=UPI0025C47B79|nr:fatty acid desaturase [Kordia sp.]MCH2193617.1 fatty acid desaturase [Kordia sp.]
MKAKVTFPKESDFFHKELCQEVQCYFETNAFSKYGNTGLVAKYILIKTLFLIAYFLVFFVHQSYLVFLLFGILGVLGIILAINVAHDAIHGIAHSKSWVNSYFKIQLDLIGANSYTWQKRHQFGHHTFPNTHGKDPDLTQTKIVKILPKATHKSYHKFQYIYVPFLYAFYTINWIYIRDFTDFFAKNSFLKKIPKKEYVKLTVFKMVYISVFIVLPILFTSFTITQVLFGHFILHIAASYFLTLALVPSHVSEHAVFVTPNNDGKMPYSWSHHQLITTTDFATNCQLTTWLLGGFNHHVAHHLFPKVSHIHYPNITPIIQQLAKKYNVPYHQENSVFQAYQSHFNLLKNNGEQATTI